MATTGIVGCGWVEIPTGKATIIDRKEAKSLCQIELSVSVKDLKVHDPEGEWANVAPIR